MMTLDDLNANQRRAVEWSEGPVLVLAGPGSGKTVVLTLRVVRLLEESENASALGLTFTNKAAAEMRDRVDRRMGAHTDRAQLCTFHSFAADILGQHGSHLGIRPDFLRRPTRSSASPYTAPRDSNSWRSRGCGKR